MKNILNDSSKFHKVYIDHDKIFNHLIHMENRVTDVLKNLRDKKEISGEQYGKPLTTYLKMSKIRFLISRSDLNNLQTRHKKVKNKSPQR